MLRAFKGMRINTLTLLFISALLTASSCGSFGGARSNPSIESLVGQNVEVTFSHDLGVLWLSNYSYPNLVLQSRDGNRLVFRDISGKFLKENEARLDGVDRFNYGAETMNQMPRVLPEGRFSVRLEDIESISKGGRVVWQGRNAHNKALQLTAR
jgi:hypothetical protein